MLPWSTYVQSSNGHSPLQPHPVLNTSTSYSPMQHLHLSDTSTSYSPMQHLHLSDTSRKHSTYASPDLSSPSHLILTYATPPPVRHIHLILTHAAPPPVQHLHLSDTSTSYSPTQHLHLSDTSTSYSPTQHLHLSDTSTSYSPTQHLHLSDTSTSYSPMQHLHLSDTSTSYSPMQHLHLSDTSTSYSPMQHLHLILTYATPPPVRHFHLILTYAAPPPVEDFHLILTYATPPPVRHFHLILTYAAPPPVEDFHLILTFSCAKTFSLLTDLLAPKKLSDCTLEDLLKALREFYVPKKNVLSERYSFRVRKQQNGETVAEYVAALKGLATTCEFGEKLDEQLRDQLVYGISSKELRTKLLSAAYGEKLKWAKVMDIVHNFESTTSSLKTIQQTPLRTDSVSSYKGKAHARQKEPERKQRPKRSGGDDVCYRCQREGHSPANCRYKDFQCRACNKKGHLERACRTKESGKHSGGHRTSTRSAPAERDTLYVVRESPGKGTSATRSQRSALLSEGAAYAPGQPPGDENCADTELPGVPKDYELFTMKEDSEYVKPYMETDQQARSAVPQSLKQSLIKVDTSSPVVPQHHETHTPSASLASRHFQQLCLAQSGEGFIVLWSRKSSATSKQFLRTCSAGVARWHVEKGLNTAL
ncbi:hypothetical protein NFI96_009209 [Prochilodus magdalenae]|nr:hypothetical protein NFI96_009209 [Prochilodus magdalenae]